LNYDNFVSIVWKGW